MGVCKRCKIKGMDSHPGLPYVGVWPRLLKHPLCKASVKTKLDNTLSTQDRALSKRNAP